MKFSRHLSSSAAQMPAKVQSNWKPVTTDLTHFKTSHAILNYPPTPHPGFLIRAQKYLKFPDSAVVLTYSNMIYPRKSLAKFPYSCQNRVKSSLLNIVPNHVSVPIYGSKDT